ncbi:YadA-like family protein, partial [Salmonella enterica]
SLKSTNFTLSSLVFALFLTSNAAYAANTAVGDGAEATGTNSTAYGDHAQATGERSTAIGENTQAEGADSTATGANAWATGESSTATGANSWAEGADSTATGVNAWAEGADSTATGANSWATGESSVALGAKSNASHNNEVNIGIWDFSGSTPVQTETRTLSGLSAGVNDDEAVNKKQLDGVDKNAQKYASDTLKSANENTERRAVAAENNAVTRSNAYTDNRFGELRKNLEHTEKRLNAGIAGVTALSSIPYAAGNNFSYGIGAGTYQNGNAVAAGVQFRVSPSTNVRLNMSWDSAGNNAAGMGIAGGW